MKSRRPARPQNRVQNRLPNRALLNTLLTALTWFARHPKYWLLAILLGGGWYAYETQIARPNMAYMGVPIAQSGTAANGWSHVLRNNGFMLAYSEKLANPLWVTYKVGEPVYVAGKRPSRFEADWRSPSSIGHDDYTGSGFDRGHMAPNHVISTRYGASAQAQTFLMTNITPQNPKLNQKSWQRLEEIVANDFAKKHGEFWVVTGPIFNEQISTLKNSRVAIPSAFYKILIKPTTPERPAIALAFIFEQDTPPNVNLQQLVTTIDAIEARTGIDFFWQLDDELEARVESDSLPQAWGLAEVANRPSRY